MPSLMPRSGLRKKPSEKHSQFSGSSLTDDTDLPVRLTPGIKARPIVRQSENSRLTLVIRYGRVTGIIQFVSVLCEDSSCEKAALFSARFSRWRFS